MNRSERKRKIKAEVYAADGGPCPYEEGTMEANHWARVRQHYWNMEAQFEDLAQAYGEFRPDRMEASQ